MGDKYLEFDFDACDALMELPDEAIGKLFRALALCVFADKEPGMIGLEHALFVALKGSVCRGD